jgi:hypothetical protein
MQAEAQSLSQKSDYSIFSLSALSFQPKSQHPHDEDAQAQLDYLRPRKWMRI